ncbi:MAG TPA: class I SAM-dependent methyltransferase [Cyanobacteria bacterium UBA11149]|nr:class I SAM-dependent methyltransferase [Cyanobacteria bacterium UBA11367]HBE56440.1 class I SAM-dependent methyltransferase [Cyanobacteria bacterium UBA11366]HBK64807.1 class I SAM-dependent methyltransferase [Cyanobacteria bacterium UBA11166]HBR77278.1 class I SAM-dependent methyltransferase [Cyanobacteria bacterium UBA11159]HBS70427.1 class I SAM-dependent methyltransferase [Cyanobacteria bacterium UBA11153]HBW87761.1 class I SAM-dependent methyltransferase [Cyanobacteria bacterium UBA11
MKFANLSQIQKRLFAWGMSKANSIDSSAIALKNGTIYGTMAELKQSLLGSLQGKVLEIGPGAGANFSYYPKDIDWIGIEPNPFMHQYLEQEANLQGLKQITLYRGSSEQLPMPAHSIDSVVSTHVLCSVNNIEQTLQEIKRILKPGGSFIFLEHVAADCCTWNRRIQDTIEPVWKVMFDNCHPNRTTWIALENAGFQSVDYQEFTISFPIVSPHIAGVAKTSIAVS